MKLRLCWEFPKSGSQNSWAIATLLEERPDLVSGLLGRAVATEVPKSQRAFRELASLPAALLHAVTCGVQVGPW